MICQFGPPLVGACPTKVKTPHGGVINVPLDTLGAAPTKDSATPSGCTALV